MNSRNPYTLACLVLLALAVGCKQERPPAQASGSAPAVPAPLAARPSYQHLLTLAELEQATGLKGVQSVAMNPNQRVYGDLNFNLPGGLRVLQVNIYTAGEYARMRADKNSFHAPIDGVGDEEFTGPAGAAGAPVQNMLFVRKGDRAAVLQTDFDPQGAAELRLLVPMERLRELARIIMSRL